MSYELIYHLFRIHESWWLLLFHHSLQKECENEKELEGLSKDLANYKVQLDAKDAAYKQALLKLDYYQKTADELSNLLKISETEGELCINECREAETRINELESKVKETGD